MMMALGARESALALLAALIWDRLFGEPPAAIHPVVWMGRAIHLADVRLRRRSPAAQLVRGAIVALVLPLLFAGATDLLLGGLARAPWLRFVVSVWLLKSTFAIQALGSAASGVRRALEAGDLPAARTALRSLCSRDSRALDREEVAAAAIESVAENSSDSLVAPLFFFACFGLPGAIAYRVANTADAMIGYHGEYEYFGKAAARLDDLLNYVPARLTALALLAAAALRGLDARRGLHILLRDGGRTESPNAGRPMAAMAGLLGVRLEKRDHYALGDATAPVEASTLASAWRVAALACWGTAALVALVVART